MRILRSAKGSSTNRWPHSEHSPRPRHATPRSRILGVRRGRRLATETCPDNCRPYLHHASSGRSASPSRMISRGPVWNKAIRSVRESNRAGPIRRDPPDTSFSSSSAASQETGHDTPGNECTTRDDLSFHREEIPNGRLESASETDPRSQGRYRVKSGGCAPSVTGIDTIRFGEKGGEVGFIPRELPLI